MELRPFQCSRAGRAEVQIPHHRAAKGVAQSGSRGCLRNGQIGHSICGLTPRGVMMRFKGSSVP